MRRDCFAEYLDAQHVGNDLFGLPVEVWVHEGGVVVAAHHVAEGREAFLDTLYLDRVGESVAQVLQLLVRSGRRQQKPVLVAAAQAPNDPVAANGGVHQRDHALQLLLERRVKVLGAANGHEAVRVGQFGKDADVVGVFELRARRHKEKTFSQFSNLQFLKLCTSRQTIQVELAFGIEVHSRTGTGIKTQLLLHETAPHCAA